MTNTKHNVSYESRGEAGKGLGIVNEEIAERIPIVGIDVSVRQVSMWQVQGIVGNIEK